MVKSHKTHFLLLLHPFQFYALLIFISFGYVGLLRDIPSAEAERLLSAAPITDADLHLVKNLTASVHFYFKFYSSHMFLFLLLLFIADSEFHSKILCGFE